MPQRGTVAGCTAAAFSLLLTTALTGCVAPEGGSLPAALTGLPGWSSLLPLEAPAWERSQWWSYRVHLLESGRAWETTLIVYRVDDDQYRLATNSSRGTGLGIPFRGNVTRSDLNPFLDDEPLPLFRFPLYDGKQWTLDVEGWTVTFTASLVDGLPGAPAPLVGLPAFRIDAAAAGRLLLTYTFSAEAGWFTSLDLFDSYTGDALLEIDLLDYGSSYRSALYVREPVLGRTMAFPQLPAEDPFRLPADALLDASMTLQAEAGELQARLRDAAGATRMAVAVHGLGKAHDEERIPSDAGPWTLSTVGAGKGTLRFQVSATVRVQ